MKFTLDIRVPNAKRSLISTTLENPTHTLMYLNALSQSEETLLRFLSAIADYQDDRPLDITCESDTYGSVQIRINPISVVAEHADDTMQNLMCALIQRPRSDLVQPFIYLVNTVSVFELSKICSTSDQLMATLTYVDLLVKLRDRLNALPLNVAAINREGHFFKHYNAIVPLSVVIPEEFLYNHTDLIKLLSDKTHDLMLRDLTELVTNTSGCDLNTRVCVMLKHLGVVSNLALVRLSEALSEKFEVLKSDQLKDPVVVKDLLGEDTLL